MTDDAEPSRPDLARDLITRAAKASKHRARLIRLQLSDAEVGMGRHADHANTAVLRRVVADHGWPGRSLVGDDGARAAWQIALNADHQPDFQRVVLRLLRDAVAQGEGAVWQWAHLHDRCLLRSGDAQEYGTQYVLGPRGPEMLPVPEPDSLDVRRAKVGLPAAAVALEALCRRLAADRKHEDEEPDDSESSDVLASAA